MPPPDRTEPPPPPDRYQRQRLFAPLGAQGDARLREATATLVGCGALGGHLAFHLARAGVGHLRLVDRDLVELTNLHRQAGFTEDDVRAERPKAEALARRLREVNGSIEVESHVLDFNAHTARALVEGADIILDGTDNLPTRFLINDLSLDLGLPWVYGGAVGDDAHAQSFLPGRGPCLRCLIPELPPPGQVATCDSAGVIGPAPAAAASFQAAMALRILAEGPALASEELGGRWVRMTLWDPRTAVTRLAVDPACPACQGQERPFLRGERHRQVQVLCGRNSTQVLPAARSSAEPDFLEGLARRLEAAGEVDHRGALLRFHPRVEPVRLTVFRDGRALIEGTEDRDRALSLYDRYVGQ